MARNGNTMYYPFQDDFGRFRMEVRRCCVCSREMQMCVQYHNTAKIGGRLSSPIDPSSTIIHAMTTPIGVTCGCFNKFCRQVGRIRQNRDNAAKHDKATQLISVDNQSPMR